MCDIFESAINGSYFRMTMLITLLMEPCNLLSWLALVFVDPAEEFEKVLVTVTDSAANMMTPQ